MTSAAAERRNTAQVDTQLLCWVSAPQYVMKTSFLIFYQSAVGNLGICPV